MTTTIDLRAHRDVLQPRLPIATLASLEIQEDQAIARLEAALRAAGCSPTAAEPHRGGFREDLWGAQLEAVVPTSLLDAWCLVGVALVPVGAPAPAEHEAVWTDLGRRILHERVVLTGIPGPASVYLRAKRDSAQPWELFPGTSVEGCEVHVRLRRESECR